MSIELPGADDEERSYPPDEVILRAFYVSVAWRRLAYRIKLERGAVCECCGARAEDGARIVTDHIRPVRFYWHLRLTETNVQNLCDDCNIGKGSWDTTDHQKPLRIRLMEDVDRLRHTPGTELKQALIAAYSHGALSQETTMNLIREYGLERA